MNGTASNLIPVLIVEETTSFSLHELCNACGAEEAHMLAWVLEGVLQPVGGTPHEWRFGGESLRRARQAVRLSQDLEIDPPGIALALQLLDEIAMLRRLLVRRGIRH
jgi:chaperone modulatory protein CbpM